MLFPHNWLDVRKPHKYEDKSGRKGEGERIISVEMQNDFGCTTTKDDGVRCWRFFCWLNLFGIADDIVLHHASHTAHSSHAAHTTHSSHAAGRCIFLDFSDDGFGRCQKRGDTAGIGKGTPHNLKKMLKIWYLLRSKEKYVICFR